ncbi:hypothetical protein JAMGFMIE_00528 [Rheinheimera sp. MM224]|nr:hypothetical protein JAMGFMIE_00528 [Rheinheimera sp. MM224]
MLTSKEFITRFIFLALLLNLPAVFTSLLAEMGLEPILLIAWLAVWANVPKFAGLGYVFDSSDIILGEFGLMDASAVVIFSIVMFWVLCAACIAFFSVLFSKRYKNSL